MLGTAGFYAKWALVLALSYMVPLYLRLFTYMDMVLPYFSTPPQTYEVPISYICISTVRIHEFSTHILPMI
jgi:uncharacterized membrane protein YhdT